MRYGFVRFRPPASRGLPVPKAVTAEYWYEGRHLVARVDGVGVTQALRTRELRYMVAGLVRITTGRDVRRRDVGLTHLPHATRRLAAAATEAERDAIYDELFAGRS